MRQHTRRIPAKGTSRRVVIVPGSEDSLFEQIICIVRDDRAAQDGVSADSVLREAESMLRVEPEQPAEETKRHPLLSGIALALVGAALLLSAAIVLYLHAYGWP